MPGGGGGTATYNLGGCGLLTSAIAEYVGYVGSGAFTQTGGTNSVLSGQPNAGLFVDTTGIYSLSGSGLVTAPYEQIGAYTTGSFIQSGGTNAITYNPSSNNTYVLYVASGGTYSLCGNGLLTVTNTNSGVNETIDGAFVHTSGTNSAPALGIGTNGNGAYRLGGSALLTVGVEEIGVNHGAGMFTQTGGTNIAGNNSGGGVFLGGYPSASGTYSLSAGLLSAYGEYVGFGGSGAFIQTGGTNAVFGNSAALVVGDAVGTVGTYSLSGSGLLSALNGEAIGNNGRGSFTQSGGTNSTNNLSVGTGTSGVGNYCLRGSGLLAAGIEYVGYAGGSSGTFTQSGGTNSLTYALSPSFSGLVLAQNPGSVGTYNLNGGLLLAGSGGITQGSGTATFNFGGGTLGANNTPWSSSIAMTLTGCGGNAAVDTTGGDITLSGVLSGRGGLTKVGDGTLILSASNSYSGDTIVNEGTLTIDYPYLLAASKAWVDNSVSGGTLDLNYIGSDNIHALYIDGVAQAAGIWGGPASGAPNTSSYLAGTGELVVGAPEPSTLALLAAGAMGLAGYGWRRRRPTRRRSLAGEASEVRFLPPQSPRDTSCPHLRPPAVPLWRVAPLLFSAVLVASTSNASAQDITYNIVNYPEYQQDENAPYPIDSVSGSTVSIPTLELGTYTNLTGPPPGVAAQLIMSNTNGISFTGPAIFTTSQFLNPANTTTIEFTPTQILLLSGTIEILNDGIIPSSPYFDIAWENLYANTQNVGIYQGFAANPAEPGSSIQFFNNDMSTGPFSGNTWVIADNGHTTPEPATLTLLGSALLGLGVVYLRRRGAKA